MMGECVAEELVWKNKSMSSSQEQFCNLCYGHALNLAASDTMRKSLELKDVLETPHHKHKAFSM